MIEANVNFDFGPLWMYLSQVEGAIADPMNGPLAGTFKAWGEIYRSFIKKRFIDNSRGGGDWAPLKLRSLLGRKRNSALRKKIKNRLITQVKVNYGKKSVTHILNRKVKPPKAKKTPKAKRPKRPPKIRVKDMDSEQLLKHGKQKAARGKKRQIARARAKKGLPPVGPKKTKLKTRAKRTLRKTGKAVASSSKKLRKSLTSARKTFKSSLKNLFKKGKKKRSKTVETKANVLVDTGTLRNSLAPMMALTLGAFQKNAPGGVKLGWDGGSHPGSKLTVGRLMAIHNFGEGRMPKRQIVVGPDDATIAKLANALSKGIKRLGEV